MAVITVLSILIYYHANIFAILPLVFPDRQFDRPPAIYHNSDGCRKGTQILHLCRDYQGEPHEIYYKVLSIKKKNEHVKVKVPSMCIPLEGIHSSRKKRRYILGRTEHPSEVLHPRSCRIF